MPQLVELVGDNQDVEELMSLPPEKILLRWMNFHLKKTEYRKTVTNFSSDVKGGEAYAYLLNVLAPKHSNLSTLVVWQIQAIVKPSVLEVLIEIIKYSYIYLMERVLDDESQEKVLTALENAGVFTFGCLVKDKVITTRWLRMFLDRNS